MIKHINVRFFIYDFCEDSNDFDEVECAEEVFLQFDGEISYERFTMFENGSDQVCLTKGFPKD